MPDARASPTTFTMQGIETDLAVVLPQMEALARQAGDVAMSFFRRGKQTTAGVSYKGGGSPVTDADFAVDRFLFEHLLRLAPSAGWLSEETADNVERLEKSSIFIVDPIDGTIAFARGDERWAVSIALIEEGRPVVGVVHAPALEQTFVAAAGQGARLNDRVITTSPRKSLEGANIVAPRGLAHFFESSALRLRSCSAHAFARTEARRYRLRPPRHRHRGGAIARLGYCGGGRHLIGGGRRFDGARGFDSDL